MDFILECARSMMEVFEKYNNVGFMFVVLLICIALLTILEKDMKIRAFMLKYPVYILLVFFCPIWWIYIYLTHDEEILYRVFWALPTSIIIVYTMVRIAFSLEGVKRFCAFICCIVVMMASGRYLYSNSIFTPAKNIYHMPETVVKICDEIIVPGREILCCFPDEMVSYVRQYTPYVLMPYGRGMFFDYYAFDFQLDEEALRDIMNSDIIDTKEATTYLRDLNIPYLVVGEERKFTESLSTYGFVYVTTIDEYEIYLDNEAYLGLDFVNYR